MLDERISSHGASEFAIVQRHLNDIVIKALASIIISISGFAKQ